MDIVDVLFAKAISDGGGSSISVEPLSVTENGTYTAPEGTAYSPVVVNVGGSPTPPTPTRQNVEFTNNETFNLTENIESLIVPEGTKNVTVVDGITPNYKSLLSIEFPSSLEEYEYLLNNSKNVEQIIFNGGSPTVQSEYDMARLKYLIIKGGTPAEQYKFVKKSSGVMYVDNSVYNDFYTAYSDGTTYPFGIAPIEKLKKAEVYEWDFTGQNPQKDKSGVYTLVNNNVTFSAEGANFAQSDSYLKFPVEIDPTYNCPIEYEIEVEVVRVTGGIRLLTQSFDFGQQDQTNGIMFWNGYWDMWTRSSNQTTLNSISDFDNKKVSFRFLFPNEASLTYPSRIIKLYSESEELRGTFNVVPYPRGSGATSIGSHRNACQMVIKSMKLKLQW